VTSIGPLSLTTLDAAFDNQTDQSLTSAAAATSSALAARDSAIADLPETASSVNQLQSLASQATSSSELLPGVAAPTLPTSSQQTQAQQSAAQPPLSGDYYADAGDAG
jgi:hypothetical protein